MSEPTIDELVRDHLAAVYGYAYRLAQNPADAEDLTQQTFLTAQQQLGQLREPEAARAWLWSIARRLFLADRRRKTPALRGDLSDQPCDGDDLALRLPVDREELDRALSRLTDEQRLVLTRFYFEEASYREIAEECQLPMGTVMSRLARAKRRLRRLLLSEPSRAAHDPVEPLGLLAPKNPAAKV